MYLWYYPNVLCCRQGPILRLKVQQITRNAKSKHKLSRALYSNRIHNAKQPSTKSIMPFRRDSAQFLKSCIFLTARVDGSEAQLAIKYSLVFRVQVF